MSSAHTEMTLDQGVLAECRSSGAEGQPPELLMCKPSAGSVDMEGFWEFFWFIFVCFAFVAYLSVLFSIITDLFRDHETSGWAKALWMIFLFVIPFLSAMIYVVVKNDGMTRRSMEAAQQHIHAQSDYIRNIAGKSPTQQIADARELLDSGAINEEEFQAIKAKALA